MVVGFVLVKATPGHKQEVYTRLSKFSEIVELDPLFGEYDFITKINTRNFRQFGEMVITKIRSVKDVSDTKTLLAVAG